MQHLDSLESAHIAAAWATIGTFDGVHRGHQALVKDLVTQAHQAGFPAVAITFFPHPVVVLRGLESAYYLTSPDERARLLFDLGIDTVITLQFTQELAALTADEFMTQVSHSIGLRNLWVGHDFALGRNRSGTIPRLEEIGQALGYSVHVIQPVKDDGEIISSSLIRQLVSSGNVTEAARLLGRFYATAGSIIHGDGRGHTIGIPTANLDLWPAQLYPASGVYATWAQIDGRRIASVTNVGVRPTFEQGPVAARIETHLLEFDRDLYGQHLILEFVERLRAEIRYSSVQELLDQIYVDIDNAREVLVHAK